MPNVSKKFMTAIMLLRVSQVFYLEMWNSNSKLYSLNWDLFVVVQDMETKIFHHLHAFDIILCERLESVFSWSGPTKVVGANSRIYQLQLQSNLYHKLGHSQHALSLPQLESLPSGVIS